MKTIIPVPQPGKKAVDAVIFCLIFLSCFTTQVRAKHFKSTINEESTAVYQAAVDYLLTGKISSQKIQIRKETSLTVIKKFDFSHPNYHAIDTAMFDISKPWKMFLADADTIHLVNCTLQVNKIKNPSLTVSSKKSNTTIIFSPVVISNTRSLAICAYEYINGLGDDLQGVLLLEKTNEISKVYKFIKISAS